MIDRALLLSVAAGRWPAFGERNTKIVSGTPRLLCNDYTQKVLVKQPTIMKSNYTLNIPEVE